MEALFRDLERLVAAENLRPGLEAECKKLKERLPTLQLEVARTKHDVYALEKPSLFTRLLGKVDKKKEKAWTAYRAAVTARDRILLEYKEKQTVLDTLNQEIQSLLPARECYANGKGSFPLELEQHLACVSGISAANRILSYLNDARKWMRRDAVLTGVSEGNRKMELLGLAEDAVPLLQEAVATFPEDNLTVGSYIRQPEWYITEPTSEFKQLDRLNMAVEQVRVLRDELKAKL